MRLALWLAWRELVSGRQSFLLAVVAMAVAVGICVVTELTYRAREVAVSSDIDSIGPSLVLVPAGRTSHDLARFELGPKFLPARISSDLGRDLAAFLRAVDGRLLLRRNLGGVSTPIIGLVSEDAVSPLPMLRQIGPGRAVLGQELARRLGRREGDRVRLRQQEFLVSGILPSTASAEDLAMFVPLRELQANAGLSDVVNVVRLFPLPGGSRDEAVRQLSAVTPDTTLLVLDNDDAARRDVDQHLSEHRWVVYVLTALVAAFGVLMWSNLNASERRVEMATLIAIGGSGWLVFVVLALRAGLVAVAGALLGNTAAVGFAFARDADTALNSMSSWSFFIIWPAASILLGVVGALPVSLMSATRQHARILQE